MQGEVYMFNRSCKALIVLESNEDSFKTYTTMVKFATFVNKDEKGYLRTLLKLLQGKTEEVETCNVFFLYLANQRSCVLNTYCFFIAFNEFMRDVITTAGVPPNISLMYPLDETYTSKVGQNIMLTTG